MQMNYERVPPQMITTSIYLRTDQDTESYGNHYSVLGLSFVRSRAIKIGPEVLTAPYLSPYAREGDPGLTSYLQMAGVNTSYISSYNKTRSTSSVRGADWQPRYCSKYT